MLYRRRWVLPAVSAVVVLLGACGGSADPPQDVPTAQIADLWREQMEQLLESTSDEFTQLALADFEISDAEVAESRQIEKACIEQHGPGLDVVLLDNDSISVGRLEVFTQRFASEQFADDAVLAIMDECSLLPSSAIRSIFFGMRENPRGLTIPALVRGCFEANEVSDGAGMSDEEFAALVWDVAYVPPNAAAESCLNDYLEPWDNRGEPPTASE